MPTTADVAPRNLQLDGLRGYAAMAVVVFHAILGIDSTQIQRILVPSFQNVDGTYERLIKFGLAIFNGEAAVIIFFIMSGAVLLQSLQRETGGELAIGWRFVLRRILRIYPALTACLVIAALIFPLLNLGGGLSRLLINLSLTDFPLIGPSWTLRVEMLAVPLLLAGGLFFRRWKEPGLLILIVVGLSLLRHSRLGGLMPSFTAFALCFALGMLIPTAVGASVARLTPLRLWPVWLLVALFYKHFALFGGYNTIATVQQVGAALFVNAVFHGRAPGLDRVLATPRAVFFGRISFTLYLANVLLLEPIVYAAGSYPLAVSHPLEFGLLAGGLIILLTIPIAYAITVVIEEPAIRLGRWITTNTVTTKLDIAV
jgi:peptidoglycan/LPS O-acetylase OafA/YrhL